MNATEAALWGWVVFAHCKDLYEYRAKAVSSSFIGVFFEEIT